jgi:hypothetical protein
MAVQICRTDGSHQWLAGQIAPGRNARERDGVWFYEDGFTVYAVDDASGEGNKDFGPDVGVISQTPDDNVVDWSRRYPGVTYPFAVTDDQKVALKAVFDRCPVYADAERSTPLTHDGFVKSIQPMFGGDGAIVIRWQGMWLAIEPDGYTHS